MRHVRRGAERRTQLRPQPAGVHLDVEPAWAFRLASRGTPDGLLRARGAGVQRLLHIDGRQVHVGAVQISPNCVRFGARAERPADAEAAIARMRRIVGVDERFDEFHARYRTDPIIGRAVQARPEVRTTLRGSPWEALVWAITEQLIEYDRAVVIQRRIVGRWGPRCPDTGLRDVPGPEAILAVAPAELASMDLAMRRATLLRRVAAEIVRGRIDLDAHDEQGRRAAEGRLQAIPGIGSWTLDMLAWLGHGRQDRVPAGDVGFLKLVGRLQTGNPKARADEAGVREFFTARWPGWEALAGEHLRVAAVRGWLPVLAPRPQPSRLAA